MTISARIVADSTYEGGKRLTTFVLRYPRFVHAEFMTHRVFSRNAASSRAIPTKKFRANVRQDPACPVFWGKNQSGMQAAAELTGFRLKLAKLVWFKAMYVALFFNWVFEKIGLHKQIANRILEPWMHIEVVCTGTDFDNFYALRDHPMAQPEIQELARKMLEAHNASVPRVLKPGQWHLPFMNQDESLDGLTNKDFMYLAQLSSARCARVSYLNHNGTHSTREEDLQLFERLMGGSPKHASPSEHQARVPVLTVDFDEESPDTDDYEWDGPFRVEMKPERRSNFDGWVQHRKLIEGETIHVYEKLQQR